MITVLLAFLTACLLAAAISWLLLAALRVPLDWVTSRYVIVAWNNRMPRPGHYAVSRAA